eukprot:6211019-Pleurochrysis_carterae.AAC.6
MALLGEVERLGYRPQGKRVCPLHLSEYPLGVVILLRALHPKGVRVALGMVGPRLGVAASGAERGQLLEKRCKLRMILLVLLAAAAPPTPVSTRGRPADAPFAVVRLGEAKFAKTAKQCTACHNNKRAST